MSHSTRIAALVIAAAMASFVVACSGDTSQPNVDEGFSDLTSTSSNTAKSDSTDTTAPAKTPEQADKDDSSDPANRRNSMHSADRTTKDPLKGN